MNVSLKVEKKPGLETKLPPVKELTDREKRVLAEFASRKKKEHVPNSVETD
jgi:hypothetical protein